MIEYKVHANTRITRKPVAQLNLPPSVNIGGYLRDGKAHMVNGNTTFEEGDLVVLFCLKNDSAVSRNTSIECSISASSPEPSRV